MPEPKINKDTEEQHGKMSVMEFCDSIGIRERDKITAGMLYRSLLKTEKEWKEILKKDQVIDFENPSAYKKEDEKRSIIEFKKTKQ